MPGIRPFRGWRYDLNQVGVLEDVLAPPATAIDEALQTALYKRHACNFIRLVHPRIEPGDIGPDEPRQRAAGFLKRWQRSGVLVQDETPAVYAYQRGSAEGVAADDESVGPVGCLALVHCEVLLGQPAQAARPSAANAEELVLLATACLAHLVPVVATHRRLPFQDEWEQTVTSSAACVRANVDEQVHRLWSVTELEVIQPWCDALESEPLVVKAGEAYCRSVAAAVDSGALPPEAAYVLTLLFPNDRKTASEPRDCDIQPPSGLVLHAY